MSYDASSNCRLWWVAKAVRVWVHGNVFYNQNTQYISKILIHISYINKDGAPKFM